MSKSYVPIAWKEEIIKKQRGYCASPNCAKLHHGKKMKVTLTSHFDHKIPEAMNGKNIKLNIQALCPNCHAEKSRKDRVKIKEWKEKQDKKDPFRIKPIKIKPIKVKPPKFKF